MRLPGNRRGDTWSARAGAARRSGGRRRRARARPGPDPGRPAPDARQRPLGSRRRCLPRVALTDRSRGPRFPALRRWREVAVPVSWPILLGFLAPTPPGAHGLAHDEILVTLWQPG